MHMRRGEKNADEVLVWQSNNLLGLVFGKLGIKKTSMGVERSHVHMGAAFECCGSATPWDHHAPGLALEGDVRGHAHGVGVQAQKNKVSS